MDTQNEGADVEAAHLRSVVRKRLFGDDEAVSIGRYRVQGLVGRGGMGIVYAAWDPQLGRKVALKVLRPRPRTKGSLALRNERLLREAKAMAQLSHPNVVSVYESGAVGDRLYIAMELIDGTTLKQWLEAEPRTGLEILNVFIAAGRGLAAAHDADLVHRDFKPDNVMIGIDNRVQVLDFGLARAARDAVIWDSQETQTNPDESSLTETGTVLGTPAYMAPEQRIPEGASAASDQYSFCVALGEALFGERPALGRVASVVRSAIERGVRDAPGQRWPNMKALLDVLERHKQRRLPWGWLAAAGLAVALAGVLLPSRADTEPAHATDPCANTGALADGLLLPERLAAVERAAQAAPQYARASWPGILAQLNAAQTQWRDAAQANCAATHVAAAQSQSAYLWRAHCLDGALQELDTIVELLAQQHTNGFEHAATTLGSFDPARACSEQRASRVAADVPTAAQRNPVQRIRRELARANALREAQRYDDGLDIASTALADARAIGYKPLLAEAQLAYARAARGAGDQQEAEQAFNAVIEVGQACHHDEVVAHAWIGLLSTLAADRGELDAARRFLAPAKGAVARLGRAPLFEAQLLQAEAALAEALGDYGPAVKFQRQALAIYEEELPVDHPWIGDALHGLAKAMRHSGDFLESLKPARRALGLAEQRVPPHHPALASPLTSVGTALGATGDHEGAFEHFQRANVILRDALGPRHPRVAAATHNVGNIFAALHKYDEAAVALEQASQIDEATLGAGHPHRAPSLYALAMVYKAQGRLDRADAALSTALGLLTRAWGDAHPDVAYILVGLGNVSAARLQYPQAIEYFGRVRTMLAATIGSRHPRVVHATIGSGLAHLELGKTQQAIKLFEEALAICREHQGDPLEAAEAMFGLARALAKQGGHGSRPTALAADARASFVAAGPKGHEMLEHVDAWTVSLEP